MTMSRVPLTVAEARAILTMDGLARRACVLMPAPDAAHWNHLILSARERVASWGDARNP